MRASEEMVVSRTNRPSEHYNNPRGALFILSGPWSQVASFLIAIERFDASGSFGGPVLRLTE